jgi:hypothetical protein
MSRPLSGVANGRPRTARIGNVERAAHALLDAPAERALWFVRTWTVLTSVALDARRADCGEPHTA